MIWSAMMENDVLKQFNQKYGNGKTNFVPTYKGCRWDNFVYKNVI